MNTEAQLRFKNYVKEMDDKFLEFRVKSVFTSQDLYWMHRNCVVYDYEINRLRRFHNPCRVCLLPLHLTKNYEISMVGPVCSVCYDLHSAMMKSSYFVDIQRAENAAKRFRPGGMRGGLKDD